MGWGCLIKKCREIISFKEVTVFRENLVETSINSLELLKTK